MCIDVVVGSPGIYLEVRKFQFGIGGCLSWRRPIRRDFLIPLEKLPLRYLTNLQGTHASFGDLHSHMI
jgi:hypothetical protein